jgi:hypothetical protein
LVLTRVFLKDNFYHQKKDKGKREEFQDEEHPNIPEFPSQNKSVKSLRIL